jgi:anti-sigma factor RsiW
MKCDDVQPRISVYVDEALSDAESAEVFSHLSGCSECRGFLRSTLDIRNAIAGSPKPRAPQSGRILAFAAVGVRGQGVPARPSTGRKAWSRRLSLPLPAAAAIGALLLASLAGLASLWLESGAREEAARAQVLNMTRMPVVEIYAPRPPQIVKPQ